MGIGTKQRYSKAINAFSYLVNSNQIFRVNLLFGRLAFFVLAPRQMPEDVIFSVAEVSFTVPTPVDDSDASFLRTLEKEA